MRTRLQHSWNVHGTLTVAASHEMSRATLFVFLSVLRCVCFLGVQLREGVVCTGFVNKVAPLGLHVNFYGNVHGLLPVKVLTRHGIQDPAEAFTVGQVFI